MEAFGAVFGFRDGRIGEDAGEVAHVVSDVIDAPEGAMVPGDGAFKVAELALGDVFEAHCCGVLGVWYWVVSLGESRVRLRGAVGVSERFAQESGCLRDFLESAS